MDEHLQDFLAYIGSEKGLSLNTIEAYKRDCSSFTLFLQNSGVTDFAQVQINHFIDYLDLRKQEGYASSSLARNLIALKVLFRFLKRENILKQNIAFYISAPKLWQLIPEVLSSDEVERLIAQPNIETQTGVRDKAIIEMLYACGLRVSEICNLKIVDVDEDCIKVFGKGKKERLVPLGKYASKAVDDYLLKYRSSYDSETQKNLFLTQRGRPINRIDIWKMIKNYAKQANITKNISPHTLRHSFATHLLDNGAELRVIQELLGHANITSTDRYTHISKTHIQEAFNAFHPRQ